MLTFVCNIKYALYSVLSSFYKIVIIFSTIFVIIIHIFFVLIFNSRNWWSVFFFNYGLCYRLVVRDTKGFVYLFVYAHNYSSLSVVGLYVFESAKFVIVVVNPKSSSASADVGLGTTTILSSLVEPVAVSVNKSAVVSLITLAEYTGPYK